MAIYITGDTHGGLDKEKLSSKNFPDYNTLTKDDYLIVTGDFGIWKFRECIDFIEKLDTTHPYTTLFVEGNHEDYNYLKTFPIVEKFNGKVRKINNSVFQLMRGEIYTINGIKFFTFGGARSIDIFSAARVEGIDWFREEECSYEEELYALNNLKLHNNQVDFIVTHTCPTSTLQDLSNYLNFEIAFYDNQCKFFEEVKNTISYKGWLFGHFHNDILINPNEMLLYHKVYNLDEVFTMY